MKKRNYKKLIKAQLSEEGESTADIIDRTVDTIGQMFLKMYSEDYGDELSDSIRHTFLAAQDRAKEISELAGQDANLHPLSIEDPDDIFKNADINFFQNMHAFLEGSITDTLRNLNYKAIVDAAIALVQQTKTDDLTDQELKDIKYGVHNKLPETIGKAMKIPFVTMIYKDTNIDNLEPEFGAAIDGLVDQVFKNSVTHDPQTPRTVNELLAIPMHPDVIDIKAYITGLNEKRVIAISIEDAKTQVKFMVPTLKSLFDNPEAIPDNKADLIHTLADKFMQERGIDSKDIGQKNMATQIARIFVGQNGKTIEDYIQNLDK